MIRKFIGYYKPHRKLFFIDMLCAFIVALCDLFYPVIAKDIINEYVPSQNLRLLLVWAGVLLGIYALKALLNYIIQYWGHVVGVRMQGDMRRDMFRRLQKLPFSFYDENKTGAVMSRLINDLFDVSELAHHGPEDLFLSAIMLVGSFVMLATIDVWLTLIVFAFLPFIVLFAVKTRKEMNRAFKKAREEIAEINAGLETSISGVRVTRAYTAEDYENAGFDRANEGARIHRKLQKAAGEGYQAEVFLSAEREACGIAFTLEGRADGIFTDENGTVTIDEIKTTTVPYEEITEELNPCHWAQGKIIFLSGSLCSVR